MRTAFIRTLCEAAERDTRIWLLTGDLGFSVLEEFSSRFPDRYINVGVAEQNMTGIAAGLAISGKVVFTYSIANFPTFRCLEQIRNDVSHHEANVKIVSVGGGFSYGSHGYSHHGIEDIAVMRSMPGMTIIAPGDPSEARLATIEVARHPGPCYLRLGKANEPMVHMSDPDFRIGRAIEVQSGSDISVITTGGILKSVVEAARHLALVDGLSVGVFSMHTVKPLDKSAVLAAARSGAILTVEEHSITGGLGSAVAEVIAETACPTLFRRYGVPDRVYHDIGSQEFLRNRLAGDLISAIKDLALSNRLTTNE